MKLDKKLLRRLISFTVIGFLGLIGANFVSMALFGLEATFWIKHASSLLNAAETLEALGDSSGSEETGLAGTLKTILSPTNPFLNFLLIPIKMVFVWISPFPVISGVFSIPITNIEIKEYGHCDILDTAFSNIMHNTFAEGNYDRNSLNEYRLLLNELITLFINDNDFIDEITENHYEKFNIEYIIS